MKDPRKVLREFSSTQENCTRFHGHEGVWAELQRSRNERQAGQVAWACGGGAGLGLARLISTAPKTANIWQLCVESMNRQVDGPEKTDYTAAPGKQLHGPGSEGVYYVSGEVSPSWWAH